MSIKTNETQLGNGTKDVWRTHCFDLIRFMQAFSWFDEREEFYAGLAAGLQDITGAAAVNIRLLSPTQDSFVLYAHHGNADYEAKREFGVLSANVGRMPHLIETGEPIIFDFAHPKSGDVKLERDVIGGFACSITVALKGPRGIVGALDFIYRSSGDWSEDDIAWLCGIGEFVGAIIDNALLSDNMFSLRVAEERRSLSNEIHDNLAQTASVITMETNNALDSLEDHDEDMLRRNLNLLKRAGDEMELIVRSELSNLRTVSASGEASSLQQLEEMAIQYCKQWGIECEINCDDKSRSTIVPSRIVVQLIRVVNEALVNIIRHARASRATLAYKVDDDGLHLTIQDDGCGFDPSRVPSTHLGLRIMKERLETVGAMVEVESSVGNGTCVRIEVPYLV